MKKAVHFFSNNTYVKNREVWAKFGLRGKQAMEFAELNLPIVPGFIIDSSVAAHLDEQDVMSAITPELKKCEKEMGKTFGYEKNPLLVKVVISPNLAIVNYPTLHNFGLTDRTLPGFSEYVGEEFAYHEILYLLSGALQVEQKVAELEGREKEAQILEDKLNGLKEQMSTQKTKQQLQAIYESHRSLLPDDFFTDAQAQLRNILLQVSKLLNLDELDDEDAAILIQPMVYGNYGEDSGSGEFFTRNIVTGDKELQGWFLPNTFDALEREGKELSTLGQDYMKKLERTARTVEDHFKEIRSVRFTIENKKLWFVDQRPLMAKSTQSDIRTLLDLYKRKKIDLPYMVNAIKPGQLNEILHPVIDNDSVKDLQGLSGGVAGAPGAAIGRVYFSTESLLEAYKEALQKGEDTRMILCMPSTFAEDVKAIEVATGVLSSEGGYSAHASVVARQYGKVSLVNRDLAIEENKAKLGKTTIKEGDVITLDVPYYGDPVIYLGEARLIEPDPQESGLISFVETIKKGIEGFNVRVNADNPDDAASAVQFGADGIGLCRTEHMFFKEERINEFRRMIVSSNTKERNKVLTKLKKMQLDDFHKIFKAMDGKEVTIRLLDAPLHEFLPHNERQFKAFIDYLKENAEGEVNESEIRHFSDSLNEFNPMLGHRGCRIAVSYPEIYEMQVEAIFEAAYKARKEGVDVRPEIMIPLIMNANELKLIIHGKRIEGQSYKGLSKIEEEVREKQDQKKPVDYKFGTMIELPVAALAAGDIARYAEFFSFGTNDLTQTTIGLSRDDYTSFMADYTLFDILNGNPFQLLEEQVKELITTATRRGKMTRPDLHTGLCGEHGAVPENIEYCMNAGLDYVSCSLYSVPIALLAVAQQQMPQQSEG